MHVINKKYVLWNVGICLIAAFLGNKTSLVFNRNQESISSRLRLIGLCFLTGSDVMPIFPLGGAQIEIRLGILKGR